MDRKKRDSELAEKLINFLIEKNEIGINSVYKEEIIKKIRRNPMPIAKDYGFDCSNYSDFDLFLADCQIYYIHNCQDRCKHFKWELLNVKIWHEFFLIGLSPQKAVENFFINKDL